MFFKSVSGVLINGFLFFISTCRYDIIESVLCGSLFPVEFSISDIVKHWIGIFSRFDKVEVKALENILE